jgi:hypothetical protein
MDMKSYAGKSFIKVDDVRPHSIKGKITFAKEGQFNKPDLYLHTGDILSLNTTNVKALIRAFGSESKDWTGKWVELYLGTVRYQGADNESVLVRPLVEDEPAAKPQPKQATGDGKPSDDSSEIPF